MKYGLSGRGPYIHRKYELRRNFCQFLLRQIGFRILVKVEKVEGLEFVPEDGPGILMINHIAFVDPIVVLGVLPRNINALAKIEAFHYPVIGIFPHIWGAIAVRREEIDRQAVRNALRVLDAGELILLAPEGTRSPSLRRGREGVAYLGQKSGAPIIPVAVNGSQGYPSINPSRWRQGGVHIRFGKPFRYKQLAEKRSLQLLRKMTDEAMYLLSRMLPEDFRGDYSDTSKATEETIEFLQS
jgi:1-acyl-sn-glycerol-3-phosphate acyltransferase